MEPQPEPASLRKSTLLVFAVGCVPVAAAPDIGLWYAPGVVACALLLAVHVPRLAFGEGQQTRGARLFVFVHLLVLTPLFAGLFPGVLMGVLGAGLAVFSLMAVGFYSCFILIKLLLPLVPLDWLTKRLLVHGASRWRRREALDDARCGADVHRDGVDRLP